MSLFNRIRQWWWKVYRSKKVTAQGEVYMVVYRPMPDSSLLVIRSIHKRVENAHKFYKKELETTPDDGHLSIERYGLWD